jgi:hypothetical protein
MKIDAAKRAFGVGTAPGRIAERPRVKQDINDLSDSSIF